jgi:DNA-binding transcriptional LysR family regulator
MQLRFLKTFTAVATTLNVTRASELVHLAQSSVTEQIQALEADLGAPLFDRSRRGLKLTPAGRRLVDYAGELLSLADEARAAVSDAAGAVGGRLTIGGLETFCAARLPALLAQFRQRHPNVELILRTADSGQLRGGVKSGAIDVCFLFGDAATGPDLRSEQVAQERLVIIAPRNHRLAGREVIQPDDLADDAFLVTETGCVYRRMFEEAFAATLPDRPKLVGEFASIAAIWGLVEAGLGCALVPHLAVPAANVDIVVLPWIGNNPVTPITMIWRRRRVESPALGLFLAAARTALAPAKPAADRHRHEAPFP